MICKNCGKVIRIPTTGTPYCGCRFYNSKILKYFIVEATKMKLTVRRPLWVVAQGGVVGLLADGIEITLTKLNGRVYVSANGERLGAAEFITLPPFVEKLMTDRPVNKRKYATVTLINSVEATEVLTNIPGATIKSVEGKRITLAIPIYI
jgi:hypothetical protein